MKKFENYYNSNDLKRLGVTKVGKNVFIKKNCLISNPENLFLKNNIRIDDFCSFFGKSKIYIDSNVHIASYSLLNSSKEIKIGKWASISYNVHLITASEDTNGDYFTNPTLPIKYRRPKSGKIIIKNHCWIGTKSTVLQGCVLGEGSVVAAHSLVNKSLDPWTIYMGFPAVKFKKRNKGVKKFEKETKNYFF